jgi:catechol 2,3-dioxygenase-like lactoylglutathione lyase family enzyme
MTDSAIPAIAVGATASHREPKQLRFSSLVIFVREIQRSSRFYRRLLNLESTVENESGALLVGADGNQVYLRSVGDRAALAMGGLGPRYVVWSAESEEQLRQCEAVLRSQSSHVLVTSEKQFLMVEGRDPDGAPVIVTFPGPDQVPRDGIIPRIFGW